MLIFAKKQQRQFYNKNCVRAPNDGKDAKSHVVEAVKLSNDGKRATKPNGLCYQLWNVCNTTLGIQYPRGCYDADLH